MGKELMAMSGADRNEGRDQIKIDSIVLERSQSVGYGTRRARRIRSVGWRNLVFRMALRRVITANDLGVRARVRV